MKRLTLSATIVLVLASVLSSCGSTPKPEKNIEQPQKNETSAAVSEISIEKQTENRQKDEKTVNKQPEKLQDPPDVVFAKKLHEYLDKNDMNSAIAAFDTMPDSLKNNTELQILHASLLVSAGRGTEAAEIGNELQVKDSKNIDVLELNEQIAAANGEREKSSEIINQILAVDPNNVSANIRLAQQQVLNHKYKLAYNYYKKALTNEPDNTDALFGCGQMAYYLDKLDEAKQIFQKILERESTNADALAYMGKLAAEQEKYQQATKYIQDAIKYSPNNYNFYLDLGTYQQNQENYDDAAKAWTKAIELEPDYFLAYTYRAGLYNEMKRYDDSLTDYYNVVRTNPKYYYAYEEIGMLEWHQKNWAKSRQGFMKVLEFSKDDPSYKLMIAATYLKEKNTAECKNFLKKAMKNMDTTSVEYNMLRLYFDQGGINTENALLSKIDKIEKTTPRGKMWFYMGLYYELKGSQQLAEEFYTKIMNMQTPMFFEYELAEWGLGK
ncbi:MAG: tetratricopeptide repeat protein [Treponema sp.]